MSEAPLISVVIPCYQAANFLGQALASVAAQIYPHWEVLAVEDGSHDDTPNIVEQFAREHSSHRVDLVKHERNEGVSAARNTGIRHSGGAYIAFLDHDDCWRPRHLEAALEALDAGADVSFSSATMFFDGSETEEEWPTQTLQDDWRSRLFEQNRIALSSVVVLRAALDRVGLFDTSAEVQHAEDYDLWLRMVEAGLQLAKTSENTLRYRRHSEQASSKAGMMLEREWAVISRHVKSYPAPTRQKRRRAAALALRTAMHFWCTDPRRALLYLCRALRLDLFSPQKWWLVLKALARCGQPAASASYGRA